MMWRFRYVPFCLGALPFVLFVLASFIFVIPVVGYWWDAKERIDELGWEP